MSSGRFARIEIVQSLPSHDLRTGKMLRDDIEPIVARLGLQISVRLTDVQGASDFLRVLENIRLSVAQLGVPILHVECHGTNDKKSLQFADGSTLSWQDLKHPLTDLNIATECSLLIALAMCFGAYLGDILKVEDRAPCMVYVGPKDEAKAGDLARSFGGFYRELLTSGDAGLALRELQSISGGPPKYFYTSAEMLFRGAYKSYREKHSAPAQRWERAKALRNRLISMGSKRVPTINELVALFPETERNSIAEIARHFFMIDLFPANASRFPTTIDQLRQRPGMS